MAKANRPSSIDVLPDEVKSLIGKLRMQGRTIDDILSHLQTMDVDVSRSALGRHVLKLSVIGERMKLSRDMATALVDRFGAEPDNRLARLNLEMMHSIVLDIMTAQQVNEETGEVTPIQLDAEQGMFLARALKDLASAQKIDQDRFIKAEEEALKKAANAVDAVATAEGWGIETKKRLWDAVVGVAK